MSQGPLTREQISAYHEDGFLIVKSVFSGEEIDLLRERARHDKQLDDHSIQRADGAGGVSRLAIWNHPGNGIYGMFARCEPMVGLAQQLLGDEPYHYHSKMSIKEPRIGGAWEWHQDYGYWYQNGVLKPDLCSIMIAVDPATRENGCLQVIRSSHKLGRIDHKQSGTQAGADMERVQVALERMELVYCEADPGDIIAFHCNTLHRSDANLSANPRWGMICCYNARSNDPYKDSHHPTYTPLHVVPRSQILQAGHCEAPGGIEASSWLQAETDRSASSLEIYFPKRV